MTAGRRPLAVPTTARRQPPAAAAPGPDRQHPRSSRFVVAAVLTCAAVLLLALLLGGGRPVPSVAGLPDAGPFTGWALPAARLVLELAAVTTVGALLLAGVLLPSGAGLSVTATAAVRSAAWSASLWSVSTVVLWLLTASEAVGVPLGGLTSQHLVEHAGVGLGRGLLLAGAVTAVLALGCARARTATGACWLLLLAGAALLPTTVNGHASSADDHELAVSSLVVHVVAAAVWAGGLLAVLLFVRRPSELARAVTRFSTVALACFVLVALSGLLSAYERLGLTAGSWSSGYGALVLAKTASLAALGAMGWQHRRRLVPALAAGRPGAFLSFAGVELCVMGGAFALAVALSRTPTPTTSTPTAAVASHGAGHETLPTTVEPLSLATLLVEWRLNAIVLAVVGLLGVAYLSGVRRLRAHGTRWPVPRTSAFACGLALALVALSSGVATYAAAMLSVQVAQFVLLLVGVPALLLRGAPLALLEAVRASHGSVETTRTAVSPPRASAPTLLTDPLTGMVLVAALVFAVYRTGLLDQALGSAGLFLTVNTAALAVGCLLLWPALGTGALVQQRSRADRVAPPLAAAASLGLLALELRSSDTLLAGRWFAQLGWSWVDPAADQRSAALFAVAGAVLLLVLAGTVRGARPPVTPYPDTRAAQAGDRRRSGLPS